jgi:hypothetical protein
MAQKHGPNKYIFEGNICRIQIYKRDGFVKHEVLIDAEDYDKVKNIRWSTGNRNRVSNVTKNIQLSRLVMDVTDPSIKVDHKFHNQLDNRKYMLRICVHQENSSNRRMRRDNTSGSKGIYAKRGKWCAEIYYNNERKHLGTFNTKEEAAQAYDMAAKEVYGTYALTNTDLKRRLKR